MLAHIRLAPASSACRSHCKNLPILIRLCLAPACSCGIILDEKKIKIESPGYSDRDDYPNDSKCVWIIKAPAGKVCTLAQSVFFNVACISITGGQRNPSAIFPTYE